MFATVDTIRERSRCPAARGKVHIRHVDRGGLDARAQRQPGQHPTHGETMQ
jgi:hypothetical protein